MFNFRIDSLKVLLNKKFFRNGIGAYCSMRFLLLPLVTIVSLLLGVALINAQNIERLLVSSAGSNQVLRYNGSTGSFIDAFVTSGSGGLDLPFFLVFFSEGSPIVVGGGGCSVARAGAPVSLPMLLLVPVLVVVLRRLVRARVGDRIKN